MSCPPGHLLAPGGGCYPRSAFLGLAGALGAAGTICQFGSGYGVTVDTGLGLEVCGPYATPGSQGPCQIGASLGYIDAAGYCVISGGSGGTSCAGLACAAGLVAMPGGPNGCACWCPNGSPPVPGTDGPGYTLAQKCPGTVTPQPQPQNCPACPTCPGCPAPAECPTCPACVQQPCPTCPACPAPPEQKAGVAPEPAPLWPWLVGGTVLGAAASWLYMNRKKA